MPLYEYECQACQRRTEKIQKFSDPELTTCPYCGGKLERTLTAPAVHFAGGGWYKDLYSSAKPPAAAKEGGSTASTPASSEGGSTGSSSPAPAPASTAAAPSSGSTAPSTPAASKS